MPTIAIDIARPAIITGASRGLGRAMAVAVAELGCPVTVNYRVSKAAADEVVDTITSRGGRAIAVQADVGMEDEVRRLVETAAAAFGPAGILINNAGIGIVRNVFENSIADFETTFRVNVRSAFLMTQACIPAMRDMGFGRLIFLSSIAARTGGLISAPYAASKCAVEGLMHNYASQLLAYGITANAISPALIDTDILKGMAVPPKEQLPLGRPGRPEEVAMVAQLLIACGYMTGQTVEINAGRYMT